MESKRTPLYGVHRALGARMIEFGGWQMPVHYTGILAEHRAVRAQGGLFDLSHMGEIEIAGPLAYAVCQELFVTDIARIRIMQAQYSVMCFADGGIVDDVIIYRLAEARYLVCVNAANRTTDYEWMVEHNRGRADMTDRSDEYALVALQGPQAQTVLSQLTPYDLSSIRRYWAAQGEVAGVSTLLARTGYTGEDGFELFVPAERAEHIWQACDEAGGPPNPSTGLRTGLVPVGLGARDTLRLEAGYLLYGNDIDARTTPLEAGLQRLVHFEAGPFIGSEALREQQTDGIEKHLVGIKMEGAGIPRQGYGIWSEQESQRQVGMVTSGTQSPMLGVGIALGYVSPSCTDEKSKRALQTDKAGHVYSSGTPLAVAIRNRHIPATVVKPPFYRGSK